MQQEDQGIVIDNAKFDLIVIVAVLDQILLTQRTNMDLE